MDSILDFVDVKVIERDVNCWFVRSEGGILYDEYTRNQYISLGWNYITVDKLQNIDVLHEHIKNTLQNDYKEKRNQVTKIINKCKSFAMLMKKGDYVIIPNQGSTKYTIGTLNEYFEGDKRDLYRKSGKELDLEEWYDISTWTIPNEIAMVDKIKNSEFDAIDSPYLKRWSFDKIAELEYTTIHPKLYISLRNPSSLANLTEHRDLLFSSIYPIFQFQDKLCLTFNVTSQDRINAIDINQFTGTIVKMISNETKGNDIEISQRMSVSSEGPIILEVYHAQVGSIEWQTLIILFGILAIAIGGSYKFLGFEINTPGILNLWKDFSRTLIENKRLRMQNDKEQYEFNKMKRDDLKDNEINDIEKAKELLRNEGYSIEAISREAMIEDISEASKTLEIDTDKFVKILHLDRYRGGNCFDSDE